MTATNNIEDLDGDLAIDDLRALERQMYIQGDMRSETIRKVLDLLSEHGAIYKEFVPGKLCYETLEA